VIGAAGDGGGLGRRVAGLLSRHFHLRRGELLLSQSPCLRGRSGRQVM